MFEQSNLMVIMLSLLIPTTWEKPTREWENSRTSKDNNFKQISLKHVLFKYISDERIHSKWVWHPNRKSRETVTQEVSRPICLFFSLKADREIFAARRIPACVALVLTPFLQSSFHHCAWLSTPSRKSRGPISDLTFPFRSFGSYTRFSSGVPSIQSSTLL